MLCLFSLPFSYRGGRMRGPMMRGGRGDPRGMVRGRGRPGYARGGGPMDRGERGQHGNGRARADESLTLLMNSFYV